MKKNNFILPIWEWVKDNKLKTTVPACWSILIPVVDNFLNIWTTLGKIKPLSGFPTWLIISISILFFLTILVLALPTIIKKMHLQISEVLRGWLQFAAVNFFFILCGIGICNIKIFFDNHKNYREFNKLIKIERQYIADGTHGLKEYYQGNYSVALDSLKLYCESDPVSACYYAELIYDGYTNGSEQYQTENALRLLQYSADKNFYRAIFKLHDYYYREELLKEAGNYAEQLLKCSSGCEKKLFKSNDSITIQQTSLLDEYCTKSFRRLITYLVQNNHSESDIKEANKWYKNFIALKIGKKEADILEESWKVWSKWKLEDSSAKDDAKKLVSKYPGEVVPACLYADVILFDKNEKMTNKNISDIQDVEKVLLRSLRYTTAKAKEDSLSYTSSHDIMMVARYLTEIYDSTGYTIEAAEMSQLLDGLEIIEKYRGYEKEN